MRLYYKSSILAINGLVALLFIACTNTASKEEPQLAQIQEVKLEYAPDKRTVLYDVASIKNGESYVLKGESNSEEAINALKTKLSASNVNFVDSIQLLPAKKLEENTQAIINISVANLRSNPKHSAELATQATLGTPVKVWKREGDWYLIQTPDRYLSWVDAGGIQLMNAAEMNQWKSAKKLLYTKTYGHSYTGIDSKNRVSDLVAGNVLEITNSTDTFYKVRYPDGREAYVPMEEAEEYDSWLEKLNPNEDALISTAETLMGVPYLWGGTSTKGMDCSGFTKTIYFLNGMVIPRDASQQVHTGKPIDSLKNFDQLQKGDLLFFGRKATDSTAEKVVHVGMWIGNNEFIHASEMVRISSMDLNANNYDEHNRNRYLRSKRILKEKDEALISLAETPLFKD